jgi:butyryl-CoA dehydrogenase
VDLRTASTSSPRNIVHLVLAKIPDDDGKLVPGTRGISLFVVPKKLVGQRPRASLTGERNDVALAGLEPQARATAAFPNTLLNFGEGKFCTGRRQPRARIGYRVGQPRPRPCAACST